MRYVALLLTALVLGCGGGVGGGDENPYGWFATWVFETPEPCSSDTFALDADVVVSGGALTVYLHLPATPGCPLRTLVFTGTETGPETWTLATLSTGPVCQFEEAYGRGAALDVLNATFTFSAGRTAFTLEGDVALIDGSDAYCEGTLTVAGTENL